MVQDQNSQKPDGLKLFKTKRGKAIGASALLAILAILLALFFILRSGGVDSSDIVMKIGETAVYADEYDEFIQSAKDLDLKEDVAREILIGHHKNLIVLDDMQIPFNDAVIKAQWSNALRDTYDNYEDIIKHEDKSSNQVAKALALDTYVDVLVSELPGEIYLGAFYHLPYYEQFKTRDVELANSVREAAIERKDDLGEVQTYIEDNLSNYHYASESHTGIYLIRENASAVKLGGTFGSRANLIPESLASAVSENKPPFVSEVHDDGIKGLYILQTTESFELIDSFKSTVDSKRNRVKVIEYDR